MMELRIPTMADVFLAEKIIHQHISPAPLIRSYPLEKELGLPPSRRVWLKDYGWTPVGSYKLMGALNWMANNEERIGSKLVVAHSSGNFASGISFAGWTYKKKVCVIMPDTAPRIKFERTKSFGAEVRTYDSVRDHQTGDRLRMSQELVEEQGGVLASPYDDPFVIAGAGVGGLEITEELQRQGRKISQFFCQVSGGGLMAGHALSIAHGAPEATMIGVEPEGASDFNDSLKTGVRTRIPHPKSICDGLLSYDVGQHNWPILQKHVKTAVSIADRTTQEAMKWLYQQHGVRVEPSGAIATAAALSGKVPLNGEGDVVIILSGRNVDEGPFQKWISEV
jgi:threo-3-hydroxy-L-aspartate ammonia-lyase